MTGSPAGRPEAAAAIWSFTADERAGGAPAEAAGRVRLRGGLQAGAGLGVGVALFLFVSPALGRVVMGIAGFILLSALLSPTLVYAGIEKLFGSLGHLLGRATTWLLLVPLFYLFFLPFGWLFRRGRRDRLRRYREPDAATYWERHEGPASGSRSREQQY